MSQLLSFPEIFAQREPWIWTTLCLGFHKTHVLCGEVQNKEGLIPQGLIQE